MVAATSLEDTMETHIPIGLLLDFFFFFGFGFPRANRYVFISNFTNYKY